MTSESPKLIHCAACSTTTRKRFHFEGPCPRPLGSVFGFHTAQIVGMEKDLLAGRPADKAVQDWTW